MKPNPLLEVPENQYANPRFYESTSFLEKLGLLGIFLTGGLLTLTSVLSLALDLWNFEVTNAIIDLFVLIIGFSMVFYSYKSIRRVLLMDNLLDLAFQEGLYRRLEPVLTTLAQNHVDKIELMKKMNNIDLKMQTIMKSHYSREVNTDTLLSNEPVAIGTSLKFTIRAIFVAITSIASFMLVLIPGIPFPQYIFLSIFILWWVFLTSEYRLWKNSLAWAFLFLPVLMIPVAFMLVSNLYANLFNVVVAAFYILSGFYALTYYVWSVYETTGALPVFLETSVKRSAESEFFRVQRKGFVHDIASSLKVKILSQLSPPVKNKVSKEKKSRRLTFKRFFQLKKRR